MARLDQTLPAAPVAGVTEPHRSTVTAILCAAQQGLFSAAEADLLVNRVRAHATITPVSTKDSRPTEVADASRDLPIGPDRTVS